MDNTSFDAHVVNHGYHITPITKGKLGEISKIKEEVDELMDAELQGCRVMVLLELSDILGAIDLYLENNKYGITLEDLHTMSRITKRAFTNGHRT
jgi:hypothetical protein